MKNNRKRYTRKSKNKSSDSKSTLEIAALLDETTYTIDIFRSEKDYEETNVYKSGSGVAINASGDLITAAHVLAIEPKDLTGKEIIIARTEASSPASYGIVLSGITINLPLLRAPLQVDLAYLRPHIPRQNLPFLKVKKELSPIGTMVLMAGYPNEVEPPLSFDNYIDYTLPVLMNPDHETAKKLNAIRKQSLIKSGMIGYAKASSFNLTDGNKFTVGAYYIDNGMHSGASGGPVVNMQGELIATIIQRAFTSTIFSEFPVLSGSTLAISSWAIIDLLTKQGFKAFT